MQNVAPFWDPALYARERERVFERTWLFVAHAAMIPTPGDYVTNYMGEDPVIVCRGKDGAVRVLLNRCTHRGNKVCAYDGGSAKSFRCSYHGWTFGLDGELAAVPQQELYGDDFRRAEHGLAAARTAIYRDLIFATWNPQAAPLEEYLGEDLRWYLDHYLFDDPDGFEVLPGRHRYRTPGNWKLLAENFGGDAYHFATTHASVIRVQRDEAAPRARGAVQSGDRRYGVELRGSGGEPHGLVQVSVGAEPYAADVAQAEALSPAAAAWVRERHRRREAACARVAERPYSVHAGTIWPNFSFNGFGPALYGRNLMQWHPRGAESIDVWQWCLVERSAPLEVKERMAFTLAQRQSAAGLIAPDDVDVFLRIRDALRSPRGRRLPFNYELAAPEDGRSLVPELPGRVAPALSESYQRAFYAYWQAVMEAA
jgi:phenylpropionate dioxygenase-like ring-hydroxylating dioxygenase large terminal subunit